MKYSDKVYELDEIKEKLSPIFHEYDITKATAFGSYAKGNTVPYDDLDLVITREAPLGLQDYYQFVKKLHQALHIKIDITFEEYINPFIEDDLKQCSAVIYEK